MKGILKKVLIGVLIGIILMLVRKTLFINVNAKANDNNIYFFTDNGVDSPTNYDNLYYTNSCIGCSSTEPLWKPQPISEMVKTERNLETNNAGNRTFFPPLSPLPSINDYKYTLDSMSCNSQNSSDCDYDSITEIRIDFNEFLYTPDNKQITNFPIEKDKYYSFLLGIQKEDSLKFYSNSDTINLTSDSVNIKIGYSHTIESEPVFSVPNSQNYIDIEEVKWLSPNSIDNGNGDSNQAYIIVKFKIKDSAILENYNYYLSSITFDVAPIGGTDNGKNINSFFIMNTDRNISGKFYFYTYSFLENGYFEIVSSNNNVVGAVPNYDYISSSDLEILDKLESCEPLDIACHVRNISTMIKSFFVRVGNFFVSIVNFLKSLFIHTDRQWDFLGNRFNALLNDLDLRLGFLTYPFHIFSDLFNIYIDLINNRNDNYVITLPELKEPFSNNTIWQGGSLDLGYIFHYGVIGDFYDIYYMFVSVYIILLFINFLYDAFSSFINGNLHSSSSYSLQELSYFDSNGELKTKTMSHNISRQTFGK